MVLTAAEHPVENPFRTLRIPLLRDHNRQLAHAFAVRTIPTLAEPVVGGVRLTAATGFADLLAQKPVAVPAWTRTFAQMGALRRWCARSWDQTFAEKLASVVTVTAARMPRQQRRRFFEDKTRASKKKKQNKNNKTQTSARSSLSSTKQTK